MNPVEAYSWLDHPPVVEDIERLGLKEDVVEAYEIRLAEAMGLLKLKTDLSNLLRVKHLEGKLGESFIFIPHEGRSKGDVKSFALITELDGYADAIMQRLSQRPYVRRVSSIHGYNEGIFTELTYAGKLPYVCKNGQRTVLEKDIGTITENFLVVSSPVVRKVI